MWKLFSLTKHWGTNQDILWNFCWCWFFCFVHVNHKATKQQHAAIPLKEEQPEKITLTMLSPFFPYLYLLLFHVFVKGWLLCLALCRNWETCKQLRESVATSGLQTPMHSPNLTHEWSLWMNDSTALSPFFSQAHGQAFAKWQPQHLSQSCWTSLRLVSFCLTVEETWPWTEDHAKSRIYLV